MLAFAAWADRRMSAAVAASAPPAEGERPGIRDRIAQALKARFEVLEPHREAVRRGLTVLALPHNAAAGLAALHRTADAVWTAVGDSSTDWNWYSKRLLLAGVLSATTLYWLEDKSEGHERTWAFLDRQLERVVQIGGKLGQAVKRALSFPDRVVARGMKMARKSYGA
jgi:ubiquinone biosynthesis protein COQ9